MCPAVTRGRRGLALRIITKPGAGCKSPHPDAFRQALQARMYDRPEACHAPERLSPLKIRAAKPN